MNAMAIALDSNSAPPGDEVDEAELVRQAQDGSRAAFEALYRANESRIYALCWRLCGNDEALTADMVQEAFIRAWEKIGSFRGDSAFGTWMHRLTVNYVIGEKRKLIRRRDMEQPMEEHVTRQMSGRRAPAGLDQDLENAIARLPERARTVLVLYAIEGYRHEDIARIADMAVGTSKAQLHRARQLLQEWLQT